MQRGHARKRTLAGRYELAEVIGRGGMGVVYRATDLVLGRTVAVKVLASTLAEEEPVRVARFEREARAAASLANPCVVRVFDSGADRETRFIVMEYVAGRSLSEVVRDEAPLEPMRAVGIAALVAAALAAAHRGGIVHRDIKPSNVMLAADGSVKVLDFGLARALDSATLTQSALVLGSAAYMSPEQARGEPAEERSDLYSLGCVLYEMLAGRPPFTAEAPAALAHQHLNADPSPPSVHNPRVWPELDAAVLGMLAKAAADRPESAARVRSGLAAMLPNERAREPALSPTRSPRRSQHTAITAMLARAAPVRRHRALSVAALAGLGSLIALALAFGSGSSSRKPPAPSGAQTSSASAKKVSSASSAAHPPLALPRASPPTPSAGGAPASGVARQAAALMSLIAQNVGAGQIDKSAANALTKPVLDVLSAYQAGRAAEAQQKLSGVSATLARLSAQGNIASAAIAPLNGALLSLRSALERSAPPVAPVHAASAPQAIGMPPGHGGEPPGQAKKRGASHGD